MGLVSALALLALAAGCGSQEQEASESPDAEEVELLAQLAEPLLALPGQLLHLHQLALDLCHVASHVPLEPADSPLEGGQ